MTLALPTNKESTLVYPELEILKIIYIFFEIIALDSLRKNWSMNWNYIHLCSLDRLCNSHANKGVRWIYRLTAIGPEWALRFRNSFIGRFEYPIYFWTTPQLYFAVEHKTMFQVVFLPYYSGKLFLFNVLGIKQISHVLRSLSNWKLPYKFIFSLAWLLL